MSFYSKNRINLGFLCVVLTLVGVAIVSYKSLRYTLQSEAKVAESQQQLRGIQEGFTALWGASAEAYEYAITGNQEALEAYQQRVLEANQTGVHHTSPAIQNHLQFLAQLVEARDRSHLDGVVEMLKNASQNNLHNQIHDVADQQRYSRLMEANEHLQLAEESGQHTTAILILSFVLASVVVLLSYLSVRKDYAERKRAEQEARHSEERLSALLRNTSDIIAVVSTEGELKYISPALDRILGFSPQEVLNTSFLNLLNPNTKEEALQYLHDVMKQPHGEQRVEWQLQSRDGKWHTSEAYLTNLVEEPSVGGILISLRDITERIDFQEQLEYQAYHDPLTKLPNRACFMDRLQQGIVRCKRQKTELAVAFIDLDNFKVINDSMGHEAGDILLKAIAERLQGAVRQGDTVARLGGDEFTILLEDIQCAEDATLIADRIQESLVTPIQIAGRELFGSASVGIALCRDGNIDPEELMRDADTAMYHAKTNGKAGYALFHPRMNIQVVERLELEHALRAALDNQEFHLVYQPIMALQSQKMQEVEALLRWKHPDLGLVSPAKFIPVAEETGLIIPIGKWVLGEACRQAKMWEQENPEAGDLVMGVNVSTKQLQQADFVPMVLNTLEETGLNPRRLKLEITESLMMADMEDSVSKLDLLKRRGIHVAMDDFGTGYASMAYLSNLPIDTLKIDRSFIQRLDQKAEHLAVVGAIISLAQSLGIVVTSEGIETPEQLNSLLGMGVPLGQGYLFSKPLTNEDLMAYLNRATNQKEATKKLKVA